MVSAGKRPKSPLKNQKGQAITELSLLMFFLAMILLGMIFVSLFVCENLSAVEKVRFDMRLSMYQNANKPFLKNIKEKVVMLDLPGRLKQVFGAPFLRQEHRIEFYEGSYTGLGKSYYVKRELYRKIELQD